jgi:hypothetical protein
VYRSGIGRKLPSLDLISGIIRKVPLFGTIGNSTFPCLHAIRGAHRKVSRSRTEPDAHSLLLEIVEKDPPK